MFGTLAERHFVITDIDATHIEIGRGTLISSVRSSEWPYEGANFCTSMFKGPGGAVSHEVGSSLNGTERSAHVVIPVVFQDGATGHIRINYFFDEVFGRWNPVTMATASTSETTTPWPFF